MTDHKTGTRDEWLAARLELLEAEKALTRRSSLGSVTAPVATDGFRGPSGSTVT